MGEELPLLIDNDGNPVEEAEVEAGSDNEDNDPDMAEGNSDYEDMHSDDEEGEDEGEDEDKYIDTLDMVVVRPCRANNEVFNTYGEHGSSYLLHRYGFCDTGNTFDSVLLEIDDVLEAFKVAVSEDRAMAVAELFAEYPESFQSRHRAMDQDDDEEEEEHGEHEEGEDMEMDENEDGDGEEIDEEDIPMMEEEEEEEEEEEKAPPKFSIDAPGHPSLSLAVLLSLGFSDKTAFTQVTSEMQLLMHYLPLMRQFWSAFQDKLDAGASVAAAFREANKESLMKKKSVSLVCRAAYMLAEKRLSLCSDNALGAKPTDAAQLERWETAKQLRANERKTLQHCIKTYKKAVTKLN
ncbi:hypothetical protein FBU59_002954 [Linderina macrospora]|uniref:Uncharacterized protein n=1 Tax=Linderina macrospora TaxID=4868 RepID=A0ACC1J9W7_9FUNG|nr:hypothetical protein FBU59_002954 [Linderina macrospora]